MSISTEDARSLKYFWYEKGDLELMVGYSELKDELYEQYPMLHEGLERIMQGERMVEYTLDKILEESGW